MTMLLAIAAMLAIVSVAPKTVSAGDVPFSVFGVVTDSSGDPVNGATVTVTMTHGAQTYTRQGLTDYNALWGDGYYYLEFETNQWDAGDIFDVLAEYGSIQEPVNDNVATVDGYAEVNVQFTSAIPEFGSIIGFFVAAGLISCVALVGIGRRRNDH